MRRRSEILPFRVDTRRLAKAQRAAADHPGVQAIITLAPVLATRNPAGVPIILDAMRELMGVPDFGRVPPEKIRRRAHAMRVARISDASITSFTPAIASGWRHVTVTALAAWLAEWLDQAI